MLWDREGQKVVPDGVIVSVVLDCEALLTLLHVVRERPIAEAETMNHVCFVFDCLIDALEDAAGTQ
jgi:hypothetical protein